MQCRRTDLPLRGEVVFVGYGVSAPDASYDDYDGIDVKGKIVAAFHGVPALFDQETDAFYRSADYKIKNAASKGAIGFITLPTIARSRIIPWERNVASASRPKMTWIHPDGQGEIADRRLQATALMSMSGAQKLFARARQSFSTVMALQDRGEALRAFSLGVRAELVGASTHKDIESPNVLGLIRGADPALRDEVVVLSAHLDHVGVRPAGASRDPGKDVIANGAMDNAMGVAIMLDVARQFQVGPKPRRSILFIALTAEEKGLLGSDYFVHYPPNGLAKIIANVNLDMPLLLYPFTDVIGFGSERSSLGRVIEEAATKMGIALTPDPIPEQGVFTRSDHYRFVEKGVPSVFLFTGFENGGEDVFNDFMQDHYHQPSDEIDLPIDYAAAKRFSRLNYLIAREIANDPRRPRWQEGDFFGEKFTQN